MRSRLRNKYPIVAFYCEIVILGTMEWETPPTVSGYVVIFRKALEGYDYIPPVVMRQGMTVVFLADGSCTQYEPGEVQAGFRRDDVDLGVELVASVDEETGRFSMANPTLSEEFIADRNSPGPHGYQTGTHDYSVIWGRNRLDIEWILGLISRVAESQNN